jgi:nitrous oxide reductase accessory protein NosL
MTSRLALLTVGLLSAASVGGCGARDADGPPPIRFGQSSCTECRMLINEERFAASLVTADDEVELFDSVECLVRRLGRHRSEQPKQMWVHDYQASRWLDATGAFFVHGSELRTPMGGGLVALDTEQAAVQLATEVRGKVVRFDELPRVVDESTTSNKETP